MTNPFGSWQVATLVPGVGIPVSVLAQSAVDGTVDDLITEHADYLFEVLKERGEAAWKECAALLTQFILSGGHYGTGPDAAERYLAQQPPPSRKLPVLTALHKMNALCIRTGGTAAAEGFLLVQPYDVVRGITRLQFAVAVGVAGYPQEQFDALRDELCVDQDGQPIR
jgi:hypothetical protein